MQGFRDRSRAFSGGVFEGDLLRAFQLRVSFRGCKLGGLS